MLHFFIAYQVVTIIYITGLNYNFNKFSVNFYGSF